MKEKINYSLRECKLILKNNGFVYDHQTGSHMIYRRDKITISVPCSNNKVNPMLFRRLMRENQMEVIL